MGKIWMPGGSGGGTDSNDCTATKDKVLSGYTAVTNDSYDEAAAGTMANRGAVSQALNAGGSYTIPAGYHNGSGKVTANSLSSQTEGATAGDSDVLSGKTYWKEGAKRTGTMTNQGAKTSALNAGGSYTIPAGYHNGSGKVTANSLSYQTSATATAAQILSGQTAWVNGSKLTGSMANQGTKTSTLNCGGSYTIPVGYHNGSGKVTANSLSSQTSANSGVGDIRSGKTAWVNGTKITGSLATQGGSTTTPGTANKTIVTSNKIVTGNIIVSGDPNLKAENIKKNVVIFGVKGTHSGFVPSQEDLYLRGNNIAGFTAITSNVTFQSGAVYIDTGNYGRIHCSTPMNFSDKGKLNMEVMITKTRFAYPNSKLYLYESKTNTVVASATVEKAPIKEPYIISINISDIYKTFDFSLAYHAVTGGSGTENYSTSQIYHIWFS